MFSLLQAYQSYERRVIRGELQGRAAARQRPLAVQVGDLLIAAGLRLKRPYCAEPSLTRSSLTGSTP